MKKINVLLFVFFTMISNMIVAQPSERTSAWNYLKEGELAKAKEAIDKALKHEATMNDPKTWQFKGLIYGNIASTDNPEYKKLVENPLDEAYDAIKKSMELDTKNEMIDDNRRVLREVIVTAYFNRGVTYYNQAIEENDKDATSKQSIETFKKALKDFDTFWEIFAKLGGEQYYVMAFLEENKIKMSSIHLYTGYCAKMTGDKDKAKSQYALTIDLKADDVSAKAEQEPIYYIQYANILNEMGYFIEATEVIERGRALWPENKNLALTELKIYQDAGKISELADKLKTALETDPTNLNLHATYAGTLDLIARSYSDKGDTVNFKLYQNKAADAYKTAIEMTKKYKDEVKYRVNGKATSYEVTYVNENGEKKKEVVVAGWEYPFTVKEDMNLSIIAVGKEKKVEVTASIYLAGTVFKEASSDPTKNSSTSVSATITKEDIDKSNNLYDLYYNLGVLYFNPGVDVYNIWANTSDEKQLAVLEKKYMDYFEKALPYIEEAHNLKPNEKTTMQVLLNIYLRKKDNEKAKKINEEIKNLNIKK
jgi:tetratricopeptide (TPR) repeat protein